MKNVTILSVILLMICLVGYQSKRLNTETPDAAQTVFTMSVSGTACDLVNFVALENGYFSDEGLDVTLTSLRGNLAVEALTSEQIQFASCLNYPAIFALEATQPDAVRSLRSVTTSADNPFVWLITPVGDDSIQSFADLAGKHVGHLPNTMRPLLDAILNQVGVDPETVESTEMLNDLQLAALVNGDVDALFVIEPIATTAHLSNAGVKKEQAEKYLPSPRYNAANVTLKEYAETNPELIEAILRAQDKALDFIEANEVKSKEILAKHTGYSIEVAQNTETGRTLRLNETINLEALQAYADILHNAGVLQPNINVSELFD